MWAGPLGKRHKPGSIGKVLAGQATCKMNQEFQDGAGRALNHTRGESTSSNFSSTITSVQRNKVLNMRMLIAGLYVILTSGNIQASIKREWIKKQYTQRRIFQVKCTVWGNLL